MVDQVFEFVISNIKAVVIACLILFCLLVMVIVISNYAKTYSIWYKIGRSLDRICNFLLVTTAIVFFFEILIVLYQVSQILHSGGY